MKTILIVFFLSYVCVFVYILCPKALSACLDQLSDEPSPFNKLKCLKQKDRTPLIPTQVRNYLLKSSPSATFIVDLPQVLNWLDIYYISSLIWHLLSSEVTNVNGVFLK